MAWRRNTIFFYSAVAFAVLVVGALIFFGRRGGLRSFQERVSQLVISPTLARIHRMSRGLLHRQTAYEGLEAERRTLLGERAELELLRKENSALREALSLHETMRHAVIPASVIGFSRELGNEILVVDQGSVVGVRTGDVVIAEGNIYVGRVRGVSEDRAEVFLPTSAEETLSIAFLSGDIRARARGIGGGELALDLVSEKAPIQKGDLFTVLLSDYGWAGRLLLGEVRAVTLDETSVFKAIRALHLFDPFVADHVFILHASG